MVASGRTRPRLSGLRTVIDRVALSVASLEVLRREAPASRVGTETGGILLGVEVGSVLEVRQAAGPGPDAVRTASFFRRDLGHAQRVAMDAWLADGSQWIGEWHTHLRGRASPSSSDLRTYRALLGDPRLDLDRFLSLIVINGNRGWWQLRVHGWLVSAEWVHSVGVVLPS